jgi:hypothetical protein
MPKPLQVCYWFFNLFTFGFRGIMLNEMAGWPTCNTLKMGAGDVAHAIHTKFDVPSWDSIDFENNGPAQNGVEILKLIAEIELRENVTDVAECTCLELPESRYRACVQRGEELSLIDVYRSQQLFRWSDEDSFGLTKWSCVAFQLVLIVVLLSLAAAQLSRDNRFYNPSESTLEKVTSAVNKHATFGPRKGEVVGIGDPPAQKDMDEEEKVRVPNDRWREGHGVSAEITDKPAPNEHNAKPLSTHTHKYVRRTTQGLLLQAAKKEDTPRPLFKHAETTREERAPVCILATDRSDYMARSRHNGETTTLRHPLPIVANGIVTQDVSILERAKQKTEAPGGLSKASSLPLTHKDWKRLWRTTTGESSKCTLAAEARHPHPHPHPQPRPHPQPYAHPHTHPIPSPPHPHPSPSPSPSPLTPRSSPLTPTLGSIGVCGKL